MQYDPRYCPNLVVDFNAEKLRYCETSAILCVLRDSAFKNYDQKRTLLDPPCILMCED